MYDSYSAFKEGWRRIFIEACKRKPGRLRRYAWFSLAHAVIVPAAQAGTLVCALLSALTGDAPWAAAALAVVAAGLAVQWLVLLRAYGMSRAPRWAALLYPYGCWVMARIMLEGARDLETRRPVRWGGREYVLEPR
jgi:hypothetical protein